MGGADKMSAKEKREDKEEAAKILQDIYAWKKAKNAKLNAVELITEYCYQHDLDVHAVGNILSENTDFVKILEEYLYENNYIINNKLKNLNQFNEDEW